MKSSLSLTALAVTALFAQAAVAQSSGSSTQQSSPSGTPPTSMQQSQSGSSAQERQQAQSRSSQPEERQQAQSRSSQQQERQQAQSRSSQQSPQQAQSGSMAQQQQPGTRSTQGGPPMAGQTMSVSGTIESIDESNRSLTLKTQQGETVRMMIGPSMQNFDQLSKGDKVTARYTEAMVVALAEGSDANTRRRIEETVARQAQQGRPGMTIAQRNTIVANVSKVDKEEGTITLRGPQGAPTQVRVEDQQALAGIEQGDQIVISYIDATAFSVEPSGRSAAAGSSSSSRGTSASPSSPGSGGASGSKG